MHLDGYSTLLRSVKVWQCHVKRLQETPREVCKIELLLTQANFIVTVPGTHIELSVQRV